MINNLPRLNTRDSAAHKGTFGRALLIGGSIGMSGAISIAAMGALRSGAGLTTVATPQPCWQTVATAHPAMMTWPLPADRQGRFSERAGEFLKSRLNLYDAIGLGPGLGQSLALRGLVLQLYRTTEKPLVVDADALNLLGKETQWRSIHLPAPRILTPHPGEFERLTGVSAKDRSAQVAKAVEVSRAENLTIVLKGHQTAICHAGSVSTNATGNAKMAVGGSGDLLTGMIVALLCQKLDAWQAGCLACYLHGLAGDLAAQELGCPSVLATDLLEYLPKAFSHYETRS